MINHSAVPKLSRNEGLKEGCPTLCGTISQTLADRSQDRFSEDDYEFLKFHGIYQQDDRDKRKVAKEYILHGARAVARRDGAAAGLSGV
jgi:sulfite reductase beta subunit-like hemoprotein